MPWANIGSLAQLKASWRDDRTIPDWRMAEMFALVELLQKRAEDNHNNLDGVQLFYPEDCRDYDAFQSVANALDALVIPTSGEGYIARNFGKCKDIE